MPNENVIELDNEPTPGTDTLYYAITDPGGTPADVNVVQSDLAIALAAEPGLTDKFVAKPTTAIRLYANELCTAFGASATTNQSGMPGWLLPHNFAIAVGGYLSEEDSALLRSWTTFRYDIIWAPLGAVTGVARFRAGYQFLDIGDALNRTLGANVDQAPAVINVPQRLTLVASIATVPTKPIVGFEVTRRGDDAGDTYDNQSVLLVGIELVKLT